MLKIQKFRSFYYSLTSKNCLRRFLFFFNWSKNGVANNKMYMLNFDATRFWCDAICTHLSCTHPPKPLMWCKFRVNESIEHITLLKYSTLFHLRCKLSLSRVVRKMLMQSDDSSEEDDGTQFFLQFSLFLIIVIWDNCGEFFLIAS